jgi:hypothetical protein
MGLIKRDDLRIRIRAMLAILVGWVPLVLLAVLQDQLYGGHSLRDLLLDIGLFARYVIAAPLFVAAEAVCFARFEQIILHFRDSGLVANGDRARFAIIVHSSCRLLKSRAVEILSFAIAYALAAYIAVLPPLSDLSSWSYAAAGGGWASLSLPGKWHALVSVPLLIVLILGWIWRQFCWSRFLWLVSRMNLQLVPAHPDLCGGLQFLSTMLYGYRPVAFAFTVIFAGGIANRMVHIGSPFLSYRDLIIGVLIVVGLFFTAPLAIFAPVLRRLRLNGVFEYGGLGRDIGSELERKWFFHRENIRPDVLEVPDFSTTTDLYSVVANVYKIQHLPVSFAAVRELMILMALPFVPVLFIAVSFKSFLDKVLKVTIG